jgi:hypothetical protein
MSRCTYPSITCLLEPGDDERCGLHPLIGPICDPFNSNCPVCLEPGDCIMRCRHTVHLVCLEGLFSLECPLCKDPLDYLPDTVTDKITERRMEELERTIEENHQAAIDNSREWNTRPGAALENEIALGLEYLLSLGIPTARIPEIELDLGDTELLEPGEIFRETTRRGLEAIQTQLNNLEEPDEMDSDGDTATMTSDDEINPIFLIQTRGFVSSRASDMYSVISGASSIDDDFDGMDFGD